LPIAIKILYDSAAGLCSLHTLQLWAIITVSRKDPVILLHPPNNLHNHTPNRGGKGRKCNGLPKVGSHPQVRNPEK